MLAWASMKPGLLNIAVITINLSSFLAVLRVWDPVTFWPCIRDGYKIKIRVEYFGSYFREL
jgi:hypothetical protein